MARIVKEYAVRRGEILDVAQRLVYTVGYERMTIEDILGELKISKGAFYHYFGSKQALLEALIERILNEAVQALAPILEDPHLPALEKLQRYFDSAARWKTDRKALMLALLRTWYADDNAIVRQKVSALGIRRVAPLLTAIIQQGIGENVLVTPYPEQAGEMIFALIVTLGDAVAEMLLSPEPQQSALEHLASTVAAYTNAVERILGAPTSSLRLFDVKILKEWMISASDSA